MIVAAEFPGIEVFGRAPRRRTEPVPRPRRSRLGILATVAVPASVTMPATGILFAMAGRYESGILIAYLSTGTSVVAVLCGAAAIVVNRGRAFGFIGLLVGALASPPVLTRLLGWASGLG
jgi:hypothetical protein